LKEPESGIETSEPRPPQDHDTAVQCSPCRKGRLRWDHYSRKTKPLFQPVAKCDSDGTAAPETAVEPTTKWGTTWDDCLAPEIRQLFSLSQSWDRCLRETRPLLNLPQSGIQMAPLPPQNQTILFDSLASYCVSSPFPFPHLTAILHQHQSHPYKTRNLPLGPSVVITPSAANLGRDLRQHALSKPFAWGAESVRFAFAAVQACEVPQIKSSYHIDIGLDFMEMIEMDLCLLRDAQKIIAVQR
jgi:hypothetical protein